MPRAKRLTEQPRASSIDLAKLPQTVRPILDLKANYTKRLEAIVPLRSKVTEEEKAAVYGFLLEPNEEDSRQMGQVLKNQLLDALCLQRPPLPDLADTVVQMYRDPRQNVVLRDYAVQHMVPLYESLAETPSSEATDAAQQMMREALQDALSETGSSIAGTALLGMARLSMANSGFDQFTVSSVALSLAQDATVSELVQISSAQVCARLQVRDALPAFIEKIKTAQNTPIQLAAIAALGDLGGRSEEEFLSQLGMSGRDRFKPAIDGALARLRNRLDGPAAPSGRAPSQGIQ